MLKDRKIDARDAGNMCLNYSTKSILYRLIAINTNNFRRFYPYLHDNAYKLDYNKSDSNQICLYLQRS